jgi:hypothetical protein
MVDRHLVRYHVPMRMRWFLLGFVEASVATVFAEIVGMLLGAIGVQFALRVYRRLSKRKIHCPYVPHRRLLLASLPCALGCSLITGVAWRQWRRLT